MSHAKNHQKEEIYPRYPHQPMHIDDISHRLRDMGMHTLNKGEVIAIAMGSACGMFVIMALAYLGWRLLRARKVTTEPSEYERILTSSNPGTPVIPNPPDNKTIMKTIPFTVPTSLSSRQTRSDPRLLEDNGSTGSGSEPSTPSLTNKGSSMDSISSSATEVKGAYALGSIDPSLYKMTDIDEDYEFGAGHLGRIWFAVEYERESEKLMVTLMKAKNLPSRSLGSTNACDPFVRIYLMPDERRYLQSKFKKKTINPKFEESFVFQVSNKAIDERVLKLSVFDVDRHKRHTIIGHALYPLKLHEYESNERAVIWRDLEREVSEATSCDKGEIHVSLMYNNHLERLTVGVFEGKNFKTDSLASSDFYCKISLLQNSKVVKAKKTEIMKKSNNPAFNESFTFKLPVNSLDASSVSVTAMQHLTGHKDKTVGRIVLGSFMFARGKELEHWNEMASNQKEQVSQWHVLTT